MISFSQYLAEGRDAPLYHGLRSFSSFEYTVQTRQLEGRAYKVDHRGKFLYDEPRYLSFTRNARFALEWAGDWGLVLEFDQRRLTQKYKLTPYNYFSSDWHKARLKQSEPYVFDNQYEEHTNQVIKNPMSYVTRILIPESSAKRLMSVELDLLERFENFTYVVNTPDVIASNVNRTKSLRSLDQWWKERR